MPTEFLTHFIDELFILFPDNRRDYEQTIRTYSKYLEDIPEEILIASIRQILDRKEDKGRDFFPSVPLIRETAKQIAAIGEKPSGIFTPPPDPVVEWQMSMVCFNDVLARRRPQKELIPFEHIYRSLVKEETEQEKQIWAEILASAAVEQQESEAAQ